MIPVKMTTSLAPRLDIAAQTWTLNGCLWLSSQNSLFSFSERSLGIPLYFDRAFIAPDDVVEAVFPCQAGLSKFKAFRAVGVPDNLAVSSSWSFPSKFHWSTFYDRDGDEFSSSIPDNNAWNLNVLPMCMCIQRYFYLWTCSVWITLTLLANFT